MDGGFVKLLSDYFCVKKGSSIWILSSAVTFTAAVVWFFNTTLLVDMPFHDMYAIITLETAALDTPNKVAVLVTDAPAKCAPTMCPV